MSEEHQAFIKTPKQLITVVVLAFVVPVLIIVLLTKFVGSAPRSGAGGSAMTPEAIEARIQPVAKFELAGAAGSKPMRAGEQVYTAQCAACHATGAAGAPKFGDAAAWAPRIKTGYEALLNSALKGKNAMSPQGGGEFSDEEIGAAVVHMANAAGAKFQAPKAAAPAAESAAAPAAAAPVATAAAGGADKAKSLYDTSCAACHASGAAGAPKLGDKAAWAPRIKTGVDALVASAIKGKNAMPPKGGSSASDAEIKEIVEYMVAQSK